MSKPVIKVEQLSKAYQLGNFGTGTLSRDLERYWARLRGKEDPFLKLGESNDRTRKGGSDIVWSLKNLNFEIEQGDAVGIIGRNGAGKSTLLKILSRITAPTSGSFKIKGRIASLLEVGTGFHPELSGRENIYLNGAILGMRTKEISRKFDEIVDFSGVERYIDTPVKRYSSGMYVRLAFAVAAYLESEILIVDEVLAVGDAEFQKKCLGKMSEVSKGEGRTVLFVSHNMDSLLQLCNNGILLHNGLISKAGSAKQVTDYYSNMAAEIKPSSTLSNCITLLHASLIVSQFTINEAKTSTIEFKDNHLHIRITGRALEKFRFNIEVRIYSIHQTLISFYSPAHLMGEVLEISKGEFIIEDSISLPDMMANGTFFLNIALSYPNAETYFFAEHIQLIKSNLKTAAGRALDYNDVGFFMMKRHEQ